MPQSLLRLIRRCAEYLPQEQSPQVPGGLRGVYVLYRQTRKRRSKKDQYDVVYVGLGGTGQRGGIRSRLRSHRRTKKGLWTHFSIFQVWDNIRDEEIRELIYWEYAKLVSGSATGDRRNYRFVMYTYQRLLARKAQPSAILRENKHLFEEEHRCAYCPTTEPLQWDHIIPKSRGGPESMDNMVQSCSP